MRNLCGHLCIAILSITLLAMGCGPGKSAGQVDSTSTQTPAGSGGSGSSTSASAAAQWATTDPGTANIGQPVDGVVTVVGLSYKPDPGWQRQMPGSAMRKDLFSLPGDAGAAELILFHFPGMGGMAQANLQRWAGQMGSSLEAAEVKNAEINGLQTSTLAISGPYSGGMNPMGGNEAKAGHRMLATVIEGEGGPWFFKLVGPEETVQKWAASYEAMIQSVEKAATAG